MPVTGTVGWNQPEAPVVSEPWPTSVFVAGSQEGTSVSVPAGPQADGFSLAWHWLKVPCRPSRSTVRGRPSAPVAATVTLSASMPPGVKAKFPAFVGCSNVRVAVEGVRPVAVRRVTYSLPCEDPYRSPTGVPGPRKSEVPDCTVAVVLSVVTAAVGKSVRGMSTVPVVPFIDQSP
ncbi:hypothetical protein [Embleya sp. NPDC005971]|uniref:hypothetical protein n=1 Tax=Embleya sp. NPDC005971 TaxID=3156724 RepID=UPI0033E97470